MHTGVDIRTPLCPVKVCEQPRASTPAVTACAPFRNEREHEDYLNVELLSTEMEFTNESCSSHFCEQSLCDSPVHVEISPCSRPATPSTPQAALFAPSQTESVICVHPGQDSNANNELIEDECIDQPCCSYSSAAEIHGAASVMPNDDIGLVATGAVSFRTNVVLPMEVSTIQQYASNLICSLPHADADIFKSAN